MSRLTKRERIQLSVITTNAEAHRRNRHRQTGYADRDERKFFEEINKPNPNVTTLADAVGEDENPCPTLERGNAPKGRGR